METSNSGLQGKSAERLAFEFYLRTGRRLIIAAPDDSVDRKFNPYHDPRNGQFTFAPGGPRSAVRVTAPRNRPRGPDRTEAGPSSLPPSEEGRPTADTGQLQSEMLSDAVYRPDEQSIGPQAVNSRLPRRLGRRGNGGPALDPEPYDPVVLQEVFPGLNRVPGGSVIALVDNFLDLTGPARELTTALSKAHKDNLLDQIRALDPTFHFDSFGDPTTTEGWNDQIRDLRLRRAVAFLRVRGEARPLQIETLKIAQLRANSAYDEGDAFYKAGKLKVRLSREEAIGNYIDRAVRNDLKVIYAKYGINISDAGPVRVIGREYDTRQSDRTFRIPDVRVGNVAFDISLTPKTLRTPRVRGFFNSDFKPDAVVIVRARQLGPNSTYVIKRPRN